jgi:hypothetical protein
VQQLRWKLDPQRALGRAPPPVVDSNHGVRAGLRGLAFG